MMSFTRAATPRVFSLVISASLCTLAWAQHPAAPPPRPAPPMHVYAPPVYHAPMIPPVTARPPVTYAPPPATVYRAPDRYIGSYGSAITLPPVRPIRPIRRFPPFIVVYTPPPLAFGEPLWRDSFCWDPACDWFWSWTPGYASVSYPQAPANYVMQAPETPVFAYGDEREDFPQLYLKDGTILNVSDYWVVDNQLHFKVIEEPGAKPIEHAIPFEELDLQNTVDGNTRRGFRFLLRNEPFEQYVRDHPEGPPPIAVPPPQ